MKISDDNKRFFKQLLYLAPPIVVQELLNTSINLLDNVMIGRKLGAADIAAVGISNQLFFLFIVVLFGINSGSAIFVGQYWGKNDKKSILKTMGISISSGAAIGAFFMIIALFFSRPVLSLFSRDEQVIKLGMEYLRIIGFSYVITAVSVSRNAALRATGNTKLPMVTAFSSLVTNFIFNYITIFILDMGVAGAAIATVIARIVEIIAQQMLIYKLKMPILGKFSEYFDFDFAFVKEFFKVTVFVVLNEALWALGVSVYNIAYSYCGTDSQAAYHMGTTIMQIFQVFGMAIGTATAIMLSNALGAGEGEKAIRYSRKCLKLVLFISIGMSVILIACSPLILDFYQNVDEAVLEIAQKLIYAIAFAMIPKTVNFTAICGILRSGGDTRYCMLIDILTVWFIGVPLGFLGAMYFKLPIHWVVIMTYSEEIVKIFFALHRSFGNKWARTLV